MGFELSDAAEQFLSEQAHLLNHFSFHFIQAAPLSKQFISHISDLVHPFGQIRVASQALIKTLSAVLWARAFMFHEPL